jgi:hypothetical protein
VTAAGFALGMLASVITQASVITKDGAA